MSIQLEKKLDLIGTKVAEKVSTVEKRLGEMELQVKRIAERPASQGKVYAQPRDAKEENKWGFKSFGEFAKGVIESRTSGRICETIQKSYGSSQVIKAAQGMGELVGSDGGFLVPPEFSNTLFERIYENDLLSRTDQYTVSGNSMTFPRSAESSRANGSRYGGVLAYWRQEGSTATQSRPTFGTFDLKLHKLVCLAAVTNELIADSATPLEQYLNRVFQDEITFMVGDAIVNGTGAGQPLGLLNAACAVSVAKETGQAAATINTQNIVKMWSRLYKGNREKSVWLINQDVGPALHTLTLGIGTAGVVTYMPPGGLSDKPYATLMGRPVIETEFNATLGTVGDIILADLSHYVTISKGSPEAMASMHLYFDTDEQAFRVTFRIDGQPWWHAPLTPYKGSNTQSCVVTLASRT